MVWQRIGRIFENRGLSDALATHAALPIARKVSGSVFEVFFSARDKANRSTLGSFHFDISDPFNLLEISPRPLLQPGEAGMFDDSGAMGTWLVQTDTGERLYYVGWNLGVTVPFRNSVGIAERGADGRFHRLFPGPILDRTRDEPHFVASCCVIPENDVWRMWYLSCTRWDSAYQPPRHHYHIKYAESADGLHWIRDGHVAIDFDSKDEYAISRPSVLRDDDGFRMWYSYRGDRYKIGYAFSNDGRDWKRLDDACGLSANGDGWESEMVEYPFVFDHHGQRYMLYNGNGYGESGIGLAVLRE